MIAALQQVWAAGRWRRLGWVCLVCWVFLSMFPLSAATVAQETPAIHMDVVVGYDNRYRVNYWFPITATLSNDGPDVRGVLEWRFLGQTSSDAFLREIDLPRGARKRVTFSAFSRNFARSGQLSLLHEDGEQELVNVRVQLTPIDSSQFAVGVLSSDRALLNSLASMPLQNYSDVIVTHLDPALLPEDATLFTGINVLFVHDTATAALRPAQLEALRQWVLLGGQLVLSGGANTERTTAGLIDLLPVTPGPLVRNVSLMSLESLVPRDVHAGLPPVSANRVTLESDARTLDSAELLTLRTVGDGRVLFAAFDLGALRAWAGEPQLWARVLDEAPRFAPGAAYRWRGGDLLRETLRLPELRLPSFGVLVLFILLYILVIGPLNFLLLRRAGRAEWAWATIPAIVVLFVVGTYSVNLIIRGNQSQVMQVAVVQGFEGHDQAQATAFVGVFSPNRRTYQLAFPPDSLVSSSQFMGVRDNPLVVVWLDHATRVRDFLIDVSSFRTVMVERSTQISLQVESGLQQEQGRRRGQIRNVGNEPFTDAVIVSGTASQDIGTLAPGEQRQFMIESSENNFPRHTDLDDERLFNRQRMIETLFGPDQFTGLHAARRWGMPDDDGVYLLAWREQPLIETRLNDHVAAQQGLTLYVVRLRDAR